VRCVSQKRRQPSGVFEGLSLKRFWIASLRSQ
jgi:hypothetical protein